MQIQEIISLIDKTEAKLVVLLCHHNADPDAVCSAFALSKLLERLHPQLEIEIAAAQGPSRLSRVLMESLPVKLVRQPRIEKADLIFLLDTNTVQQLEEWAETVRNSVSPVVVVDHHASHPETERLATLYVCDEKASSTCEIVYRFFKDMNIELSEVEAKALFLGIAFDTRHFVIASSDALKIVADLVDAGVNAEETLSMLSLPMDYSERLARLKACQRAHLLKIGDWVIAFSHVNAYQASAARALIRLGAHVAVVAGQHGKKITFSLRSSRKFYKKTGVHLGRDVATPLGEHIQGMGGGHSTSAGANGVGDLDASIKYSVKLLREKLRTGNSFLSNYS
ncbi:MAG: DHH family phosphoesterase [Thermoproteota archaeon]|nr:DHH family phosphoesterase [Thermoproteota archaeon]